MSHKNTLCELCVEYAKQPYLCHLKNHVELLNDGFWPIAQYFIETINFQRCLFICLVSILTKHNNMPMNSHVSM